MEKDRLQDLDIDSEKGGSDQEASPLSPVTERHALAICLRPQKLDRQQDGKARAKVAWLAKQFWAPESLNLFYDLVAVAVLTVFSLNKEISKASSITSFLGFFALFWFIWLTQAIYDVRFQANDVVHRFFKFGQIIVLAYLGAATNIWEPTAIAMPAKDDFSQDALLHVQAHQSFILVTAICAIARGTLAVQYCYVILLAKRANRPISPLFIEAGSCALSSALCIIAVFLNTSSKDLVHSKIALLYSGIAVEVIGMIAVSYSNLYIRLPSLLLSERVNALTLIILGEGFIGYTLSGDQRIAVLGSKDPWVYVEVFFGVSVLACLYHFTMATFDTHVSLGRRRTFVYLGLYFPLHFCLILLFSAIKNNITALSFDAAVTNTADFYFNTIANITPTTSLSSKDYFAALQTYSLNLNPTMGEQLQYFATANMNNTNIFVDMFTYFGQIIYELADEVYNFDISQDTLDQYYTLATISNSTSIPIAQQQANTNQAVQIVADLFTTFEEHCFSGVLWLFPCAGAALFLISCISLVRHPRQTKVAFTIDLVNMGGGVALALLGCLDIGPKSSPTVISIDSNGNFLEMDPKVAPIFKVVASQYGLLIPVAVYFALILFQAILLGVSRHKQRRKF